MAFKSAYQNQENDDLRLFFLTGNFEIKLSINKYPLTI